MNRGPTPSLLHTPGFAHYAVKWSPFRDNQLAVASSANFGLIGNGRLHVVSSVPGAPVLQLNKVFETQDGLYDLAWSEVHENHVVTASGDGSVRLWDIALNDHPIRAWQEHTREVHSVDWSNLQKDQFVSASWDGNIKIWTPERPHSISTLQAHHACVYQALFNPHQPALVGTCSTDGTAKFFDLRAPAYSSTSNAFTRPLAAAALTIPASGTEVLTLDWNKYRPFVLATAGVDKMARVWDCRMVMQQPPVGGAAGAEQRVGGACEATLVGHEYAVRKVQWSPHRPELLASASYDMTCRVWTTAPAPQVVHVQNAHSEFVVGCGWALYQEGVLASCGWDGKVNVYRV